MGFYFKFSFLIYRRGNKEIEKNLLIIWYWNTKTMTMSTLFRGSHPWTKQSIIMKVVDTLKQGNICQTK